MLNKAIEHFLFIAFIAGILMVGFAVGAVVAKDYEAAQVRGVITFAWCGVCMAIAAWGGSL